MADRKGRNHRSPSVTGLSLATTNITSALSEIAERHSLLCQPERKYYPGLGGRSERVDVAFLLPSGGRPIFWFEIDNDPARAAHNLFKIFGRPHESIPVTALAVHHGRVAEDCLVYPGELLGDAVLPPRLLDSLSISTESYESILTQLNDWITGIFKNLAAAPEWGTVLDVSAQYQALIASGGLHLAVAHLEAQAELAWSLSQRGMVDTERAACLTITLARMLQRAGHHTAAREQMAKVQRRVSQATLLSRATASSARAVTFMLGRTNRSEVFSAQNLRDAFESVDEIYNKSQFLWRSAIPHIMSGNRAHTERIILDYREILSNSTAARSNIALLRGLDALKWKRGECRELAAEHSRYEHFLLENKDGPPEGTIHGFVAALYLKLAAELSCGNERASPLLAELDTFCMQAGVPLTADGIREIRHVVPSLMTKLPMERRRIGAVSLWSQANRGLQRRLNEIYAKVNLTCDT